MFFLITCASLALWVVGRQRGSAVRVGWFHKQLVSHWAPGHGGRLYVWADRCHTRWTRLLSGLAIRGLLFSEREEQRNGRRAEVYLDKVSDEITKKKDRVWHKEVN